MLEEIMPTATVRRHRTPSSLSIAVALPPAPPERPEHPRPTVLPPQPPRDNAVEAAPVQVQPKRPLQSTSRVIGFPSSPKTGSNGCARIAHAPGPAAEAVVAA